MDFFQGRTPPNFISFCLVYQSEEDSQTQTNTPTDIPVGSVSAATPVSASSL